MSNVTGKIIALGGGGGASEAEVEELRSAIAPLTPDVTASDVGKYMRVKTVADGKVTEYDFGSSSGSGAEIDDTAGIGDTTVTWSANKSAGLLGKVTENITATVTNAVSLSNMNGAYGLKRDSISAGVATYTPSSSPNTNPSIRDLCDLGSAYRLVSFKYKLTKEQGVADPQKITLILGAGEYHYFPVKYNEWCYVQIFTSVNLTRVYFMLEGYDTAPSSGITLQVKDYYVYNIADIKGEMLFNIISKQRTNYQDGQVTYDFTVKLDSGFVNAQEHGVKGNGTDDDTDTINALFRSFSGRIYFPAGTYKLSGTIEVMGNTEMFGDGDDSVFSMSAFDNMILMPYRNTENTIPYIMTQSDNVTIRKIKLVGNTSTIKAEKHWGIGIYDADGVMVSGVTVSNINCNMTEAVNEKIGYGISARNSNNIIIENCNVQTCGYECIGFFDDCTNGIIRDNYTKDGKRTCIQVHRGCSNILIDNNYMKQTHGKYDAGLTVHGLASTSQPIKSLKITNNTLEMTTNGAQADDENAPFQIMSDSSKVSISNNHIFGGKRALYIGSIDELIVSNNVMNCNSSSDYGIRDNGTNVIFIGNIMDNDASSGNVMFNNPIMVGNSGIGS